jgi:hypothetical protein
MALGATGFRLARKHSMLRSMKDLENYAISATDGLVGHLKDFYFDDDAWVVRYFVVNAGTWLSSRMVLVSPIAVDHPDWIERTLAVSITKEQVKNSPHIDTDKPVSRQNEAQYFGYYGYPVYWDGAGLWGDGMFPYAMAPGYGGYGIDRVERERQLAAYLRDERESNRNSDHKDDPHLRSCNAVTGYHLHAIDGDIGHVSGFLVDDETWAIRYLIVDTSNWWVGHKVLVAPPWITSVNWADQTVSVSLSRKSIKAAPRYDPAVPWSRNQDESLYAHHRRTGFWAGNTRLETEI